MNIDIHEIKAPGLNESNYGANIDQQFKNIDNNFHIIGNYDFIKGQPGDGVKIENVKIVADDNPSSKEIGSLLYKALKTAVESFANKSSEASNPLKKIGDFKWDDIINDKDGFYVPIIIHENKVNNTKEYICSAGVVSFFDNRFSAAALKQPNIHDSNIVDVTSLLNFKKVNDDEWNCDLNLSFPRLKFKDESFYWVINNEETSIKATGLKGERGSNGVMVIGRTEYIDKSNSGISVQVDILVDGKWEHIAPDYLRVGDIITVLCPIKDDSTYTYNGFFISNIKTIDDTGVYVEYRPEANITQINYSKDTVSFFEALGSQEPVDGAQPARGMFLLFDNYKTTPNDGYTKNNNSDDDKYAHMIYNDEHKLNISPVKDYKSNNPELITSNNPELNIDYKTNISKALAVTGATSISDGLTVCSNKLSVSNNDVTRITGGLVARGSTASSGSPGFSNYISVPTSGPVSVYVLDENNSRSEIQCGAANNDKNGVRTIIFGETLLQAESGKANNITVHPKTGITINGYTSDSSGINITGVTKIKSSTDSAAKYLKVNNNGVGINTDPNREYALNVGGDTNITGALSAGTATVSGALSAGVTTINGDVTISGGHVNVNKNIYFTDKGGDNNTRYVHHIEAKGADNSAGGENTSLSIWASKIHLAGHKDNEKNIIYLGNGGSVDINEINIQGKTSISDKLTVTSGGTTITGDTTIKTATSGGNSLTVNSTGVGINTTPASGSALNVEGKLTVTSGGAAITGETKIQSAATNGNYIQVGSGGIGINKTPSSNDPYTINVSGTTNISGKAGADGTATATAKNGENALIVTGGTGGTGYGGTMMGGDGGTALIVTAGAGGKAAAGKAGATGKAIEAHGDVSISGDLGISGGNAFSASSVLHLKKFADDDWGYVNNKVKIDNVTGYLTWPKKQAYMLRLEAPDSNEYIVGIPADVYPPNCIVLIDFYKQTYYLHNASNLDGFNNTFRMFVFGTDTFTQTVNGVNYKFRKPIGWIECGYGWVSQS